MNSGRTQWRLRAELWRRVGIAALALAAITPLLFAILFVARYGVDIPFADEWSLAPLFAKAHDHRLTFGDFFTQWHEHRMVLPKLLFVAFARWSAGNLRAEMFFSLVLVTGTAVNLFCTLRRTLRQPAKLLFVVTLINLLLFSPGQAESWTWGIQLTVFLINYLLTIGICIASSSLSLGKKFLSCAAIAIVASLSFGNGMLLWGLTFPLVLVGADKPARRRIFPWLSAWIIIALVTIGTYFVSYAKPTKHLPPATSHRLGDYFLYFAAFLGAPLSRSGPAESLVGPVLLGTLLLIVYASAIAYALYCRTDDRKTLAPWFALGAFALLSACMAAIGRIGFGLTEALASRSTTFGLLLPVAVIAMLAVGSPLLRSTAPGRPRVLDTIGRIEAAFLGLFAAMLLTTATLGVFEMRSFQRTRLLGKGALHFGNVLDASRAISLCLGGNASDVLRYANIDNSLGLLHPPLAKSANIVDVPAIRTSGEAAGFLDGQSPMAGPCVIRGWAVLPSQSRGADCVVLTLDAGEPTEYVFAINDEVEDRPDVARKLQRPHLIRCGWRAHIDRLALPAGEQRIGAWALDANSGTLYKLGGRVVIQ